MKKDFPVPSLSGSSPLPHPLTTSLPHYLTIFLFTILLLLCTTYAGSSTEKDLTDGTGRIVHLHHYPPQRIISLAPSITELLFALKKGRNLVGVTTYCNRPQEATKITKVGGFADPNLEIIASLKPDVVIASAQGNPVELVSNLDKFSIPLFAVNSRNISDVLISIKLLSQLTGAEREGAQLHTQLSQFLQETQKKNAHIKKRKSIFFLLWYQPIVSVGKDSYINEIIELSGGKSVTSAYAGEWLQLNQEELYKLKFDAIIYARHSQDDEQQFQKAIRDNFSPFASAKIYSIDEEILRPGVTFPDVISQLSKIIASIPTTLDP